MSVQSIAVVLGEDAPPKIEPHYGIQRSHVSTEGEGS